MDRGLHHAPGRPCGALALASLAALAWPAAALAQVKDTDALAAPQAAVIRATQSCFSSTIPVTGFLAARREAVVALGPGERVLEVLAREGDKVAADQVLIQVVRPAREPPRPGAEPKTETVGVKAPAAGTVIRSTAAVGATFSPVRPEPLFLIAVDGEIELEADVPSVHVPDLSAGQIARVIIKDSPELSGRVRLVPVAVDRKTQLGRARISLDTGAQLRFATFARAIINARRSCGVSVPRSAVTYRTGGTSVQVVVGDTIETRHVEIGLQSDTHIEIRKGLNRDDMVVANAGTTLRDGDKVRPVEAGAR
ncbi:MAG: efflux transporter periplasmic adaptor subunit [Bradyrhizobiaceae bacterium]|nr:MAG: efflux transporter periplasmic adaptor subunit [Bradyrhizobiaceae bacterium]